jgi:hypothetical protein
VVHDDEPVGLDGLRVEFDDERAVSDAGMMLVATLAKRLGIEMLAGLLVGLRRDRPGAANAGRKVMALLFAMVLGADGIDDCEVLRAGRTRRLLGAALLKGPWGRSDLTAPACSWPAGNQKWPAPSLSACACSSVASTASSRNCAWSPSSRRLLLTSYRAEER